MPERAREADVVEQLLCCVERRAWWAKCASDYLAVLEQLGDHSAA